MTTTPIVPAGTSPTAPTAPTVNSTTGAGTACGCPRRILGPAAVAALLDISERHLTDLRAEDPTFPTPRMCGRLPRWDAETIIAWVAAAAGTVYCSQRRILGPAGAAAAGTACSCPRRILGPAAVAALLDISERHLSDLRAEDPTFPTPRMCGRLPRWDAETIIAWVAAAAGTIDGAGSSVPGQEPNGRPDSQVQEHRPDAPTPSTRRGRRHGGAGLV